MISEERLLLASSVKNVDIVEVQKLMGHASVATTGNYVRKDEENLRKAAEKAEL